MNNAKELVELLAAQNLTIGSIESFTGGLFGKTLTDIPGASKAYKGGIIVYTPELKVGLVGISEKLIEEYGVVSAPVAERLAIKGQKVLGVDICVSFVGNAGPSTCSEDTFVGECYMAIVYNHQLWTIPLRLTDLEREQVRQVAVDSIINAVLSIIRK